MCCKTNALEMMSINDVLWEFSRLKDELEKRLEDLQTKKNLLLEHREDDMNRPSSVWMMESWSAADYLSRKEENLMQSKKAIAKTDLAITDMYNTLTVMKLARLSKFQSKLSLLHKKDPQGICPVEYTMEKYEKWLRNDHQINAKQSEIIEALTKKLRLTQVIAQEEEYHIMEGQSHIYKFDMKREFERIHQMMLTEPENFVLDENLSDYVQSLLGLNGCNSEASKLREYIDKCQKRQSDDTEPASSPQNYRSFVCGMSQYIYEKYATFIGSTDSDPTAWLDQIYTLIEEAVFPHLKGVIVSNLENQDEKDRELNEKYDRLAHVDQRALGVKAQFVDESIYPHSKAITEIMKVDIVNTPTKKLKHILKAAHIVLRYMCSLCGEDELVPGADEFMDIWVYILLKARLPRFFTTVAMLRNYSNPRMKYSETGYYMANFESAGEYIWTLAEDFTARTSKIQPSNNSYPYEMFFTPEKSRLVEFLSKIKDAINVVENEFCLKGFKLIIDYDLQLENSRLYTSFLVEDEGCCVFGTLFSCRQNSKLDNRWVKMQMKKVSHNIVLKCVGKITIPIRNDKMPSVPRRYIEIPSGRYEDYRLLLEEKLSLERVSCINQQSDESECCKVDFTEITANIDEFLQRHSSLELSDYLLDESRDVSDVITKKVKHIQTLLCSVDCYSKMLPCNGVYNMATLNSVVLFQKMYNKQCRDGVQLETDGICDSRTFNFLCKFPSEVS